MNFILQLRNAAFDLQVGVAYLVVLPVGDDIDAHASTTAQ